MVSKQAQQNSSHTKFMYRHMKIPKNKPSLVSNRHQKCRYSQGKWYFITLSLSVPLFPVIPDSNLCKCCFILALFIGCENFTVIVCMVFYHNYLYLSYFALLSVCVFATSDTLVLKSWPLCNKVLSWPSPFCFHCLHRPALCVCVCVCMLVHTYLSAYVWMWRERNVCVCERESGGTDTHTHI